MRQRRGGRGVSWRNRLAARGSSRGTRRRPIRSVCWRWQRGLSSRGILVLCLPYIHLWGGMNPQAFPGIQTAIIVVKCPTRPEGISAAQPSNVCIINFGCNNSCTKHLIERTGYPLAKYLRQTKISLDARFDNINAGSLESKDVR
jgi:hypothetical protein